MKGDEQPKFVGPALIELFVAEVELAKTDLVRYEPGHKHFDSAVQLLKSRRFRTAIDSLPGFGDYESAIAAITAEVEARRCDAALVRA